MRTKVNHGILLFCACLILLGLNVHVVQADTASVTNESQKTKQKDLKVLRISPSGKEVDATKQIVIQFNQAMVPLGDMARKAESLDVEVSPDPGCEWRWLNSNELSCRLSEKTQLAPATQYQVTVGTDLSSDTDQHLAKPFTQNFTTQLAKVEHVYFDSWAGSAEPVWLVTFNVPVTAQAVEKYVQFTGSWGHTLVQASPHTKERQGPMILPVPNHPGAVLVVDNPKKEMPLDADKAHGEARKTWKIQPKAPLLLKAESKKPIPYDLVLHAGLTTPSGHLASQYKRIKSGHIFGDFSFVGLECGQSDEDSIRFELIKSETHGDTPSYTTRLSPLRAKSMDHLVTENCRPDEVNIVFNAPVPKKTLEQIEWRRLNDDSSYKEKNNWFSNDTIETTWSGDSENDKTYRLPFSLKPKEHYIVTIPKGAKDVFGRSLNASAELLFSTAHRAPYLSLPPSTGVLEKGEATIMPFRFTNLENINFTYRWIDAESLASDRVVPFTQTGNLLEDFDAEAIQDKRINSDLKIRDKLAEQSGFLWGDIKWYEGTAQEHRFNAQITPWNILAKEGFYGTLVWVSELDTGQPVADAQVKLYQNKNLYKDELKVVKDKDQQTIQVKTNKQGIAFLPKIWLKSQHTLYIAVSRQEDMALLPLSWSFSRSIYQASQRDFWSEEEREGEHMRAWSVTDQGIYKPGSPVNYAVFLRTEGPDQLEAPREEVSDYRLTIEDPEGNYVLDKKKVNLSDFGDISGQITIPDGAPMGWYDISLGGHFRGEFREYSAGRFLVTDFVPANFKVRTQIKGTAFDLGDQLEAKVDAKLYAGGPYTQAKTTFKTRLEPKQFKPDNSAFAGFSFGQDKKLPDSQSIAENEKVLDEQGEVENNLRLPEDSKIIYGEVQVEGVVASARGKSVANTASAVFAARDRFVGLRTPNWLQHAGKAFKAEYMVADLKGQAKADVAVNLSLEYQEVSRVREKNSDGDYVEKEDIQWKKVAQCDQQAALTPQACEFTPEKAGRYRIVGQVTDKKGRTQRSELDTYVTGTEHALWSHDDDDILTLVPEKSEYQVGDKARILVQNPYPGAKALITVERYGVLWQEIVTLEEAASTIEVPIIKEAFPGAFLSVSVFSPRVSPVADPDLGKPVIAQGYMPLTVVGKGGALQVDVNTDAKEYRPGDQVKVGVKVRDKDKKTPDKTRLVAVAVDQSVVDLLAEGEDYYDPRKTFYSPPDGPDIKNYSLVEQLLSSLEAKEGKGESPSAGGGDEGPKIRDQFNYSAFWDASLESDEKGEAHFNFELPDNLTQWQVIVIAMSQDDPMGVGMSAVQSNLPIQVEAALPNQLRVGDQFEAGFDIMNRTQEALDIESRIQAEGAIEKPQEALHQFKLNSFEHELQWLSLKATQPGQIKLLATAQSDELSDGLSKTVAVRYAGSEETAAEQGSLTQGKTEIALLVPEQAIKETAQAEVIFSPTLLGGLEGAFNVMKEEATQSWETRLSRAVLAANYLQLKDVLGKAVQWPEAEELITEQFNQAQKFQAQNGGMAFWTARNDFVSPYLSVYTALAFTWLEEMGYEVPTQVKTRLNSYLQDKILDAKQKSDQVDSLRIGALTALLSSSDDEIETSEILTFMPKATDLNLFAKGLLLNATIASNDQKHADELLHTLFSSAEESSGEISFNESRTDAYVALLDTPLRSNCVILDAFSRYKKRFGDSDLLGETPSKLVQWISQQRQVDGSWPNSQENVFCTMAMTHYAEVYEAPIKQLGGTLQTADKTIQSVNFSSRQDKSELLLDGAVQPGEKSTAHIEHEGEGRLYYNLRLKYVMPPEAIEAANAGMIVKRQYFVQRGEDWVAVDDKTALRRGDIIKVELDVDTPTKRHHVVLTDPLPGAFEAVNRDLATSEQNLESQESDGRVLVLFDGGDWPTLEITEGGFYHREMAFDAVRFHADSLPAGQYRLVYSAQVIAPGQFIAPAAEIKQSYQPDVFGRDKPQSLNVSP